jgi:putative sigma-54 modulation protein
MRLELTGRHLAITPATRALVAERLEYTLRRLNDSAVSAHVVLTRERARIRAEVTLHARRERFLHADATGPSVELAINAAADKIDHQAQKLKGKRDGRKRRGPSAVKAGTSATPEAATAPRSTPRPRRRIIRAKQYAVKPMSVEDAAVEIDDAADGLIVFRNSATDTVTVLFRRADGNLGLIEPEA